jgi:cobaltochelatase CobS
MKGEKIMSEKLKCKICGYESKNLEPHIASAHADLGGVEYYMEKFEVEIEEIIHPSLIHGEEESRSIKKEKIEEKEKMSVVEIAGVELPKRTEKQSFVPASNPAYIFGDHAKDIAYDILEDKRVLLTGHTGCGKTSVIQQIASQLGQGVIRINLNGQTTIGDFVGLWTVKGGETVWVDGALPLALKHGYWLILDEIDFAEPAILAVLNAILEKGGEFVLKEKGYEKITPHENFRLFATANTVGCMQDYRGLYQGANILNEAFLDRWRVYFVDYLPEEQEAKVLTDSIQKMTPKIAKRIVMVGNMIREAFVKEEIACTFSLRRMLDWSEQMIRKRDPIKAADSTIFSKISREDSEVIKGIISRVMLGGKSE